MEDMSRSDQENISDAHVYDCPFCRRRNVQYQVVSRAIFDSTKNETCFLWFIECSSCNKQSWHLSYDGLPPF